MKLKTEQEARHTTSHHTPRLDRTVAVNKHFRLRLWLYGSCLNESPLVSLFIVTYNALRVAM